MNLKTIEAFITLIEQDEYVLPKNHKIIKAMQSYLKQGNGENYSTDVVHKLVVFTIKQEGMNYSATLLNAIQHYDEVDDDELDF